MRTESSLAVNDKIMFHRQQLRTVGTRYSIHHACICMIDLRSPWHVAAVIIRSYDHTRGSSDHTMMYAAVIRYRTDHALQKICSVCTATLAEDLKELRIFRIVDTLRQHPHTSVSTITHCSVLYYCKLAR